MRWSRIASTSKSSSSSGVVNTGSLGDGADPTKGFKRLTWKTLCSLRKLPGSCSRQATAPTRSMTGKGPSHFIASLRESDDGKGRCWVERRTRSPGEQEASRRCWFAQRRAQLLAASIDARTLWSTEWRCLMRRSTESMRQSWRWLKAWSSGKEGQRRKTVQNGAWLVPW